MQVAAANPQYIQREDISAQDLERERAIYRQQAAELNKPLQVVEKIIDGKMERFFGDTCLMEQAFIKDTDRTIKDVIQEAVARLGENIQVRRFVRYSIGEGMAQV